MRLKHWEPQKYIRDWPTGCLLMNWMICLVIDLLTDLLAYLLIVYWVDDLFNYLFTDWLTYLYIYILTTLARNGIKDSLEYKPGLLTTQPWRSLCLCVIQMVDICFPAGLVSLCEANIGLSVCLLVETYPAPCSVCRSVCLSIRCSRQVVLVYWAVPCSGPEMLLFIFPSLPAAKS
jgi:hypothetical protein